MKHRKRIKELNNLLKKLEKERLEIEKSTKKSLFSILLDNINFIIIGMFFIFVSTLVFRTPAVVGVETEVDAIKISKVGALSDGQQEFEEKLKRQYLNVAQVKKDTDGNLVVDKGDKEVVFFIDESKKNNDDNTYNNKNISLNIGLDNKEVSGGNKINQQPIISQPLYKNSIDNISNKNLNEIYQKEYTKTSVNNSSNKSSNNGTNSSNNNSNSLNSGLNKDIKQDDNVVNKNQDNSLNNSSTNKYKDDVKNDDKKDEGVTKPIDIKSLYVIDYSPKNFVVDSIGSIIFQGKNMFNVYVKGLGCKLDKGDNTDISVRVILNDCYVTNSGYIEISNEYGKYRGNIKIDLPSHNETGIEKKLREYLLSLINGSREKNGLLKLYSDDNITYVAYLHNKDQLDSKKIFHTLNDDLKNRLYKYGVFGPSQALYVTENVGSASYSSNDFDTLKSRLEAIHNQMMNEVAPSDGHKRNILDANVNRVGVFVSIGNGKVYITENFAR